MVRRKNILIENLEKMFLHCKLRVEKNTLYSKMLLEIGITPTEKRT